MSDENTLTTPEAVAIQTLIELAQGHFVDDDIRLEAAKTLLDR